MQWSWHFSHLTWGRWLDVSDAREPATVDFKGPPHGQLSNLCPPYGHLSILCPSYDYLSILCPSNGHSIVRPIVTCPDLAKSKVKMSGRVTISKYFQWEVYARMYGNAASNFYSVEQQIMIELGTGTTVRARTRLTAKVLDKITQIRGSVKRVPWVTFTGSSGDETPDV